MRRGAVATLVVPVMALLVAGSAAGQTGPGGTVTREIMDRIVQALQVALPPSLSPERYQASDHRAEILAALQQLAENGARLEEHARGGDASTAYLSHSLAEDAKEIERRYADGRYSESRFLLHHLAEVCVACHSQLPDEAFRPIGRQLMADAAVAALPPDERVQFEMATRQFDAAAASFESMFADPALSPADLDLSGPYESYLELCLRVRYDPARAAGTFRKIRARSDVPAHLRSNLDAWIAALDALAAEPPDGPPLPRARALLAQARNRERYPDDRAALVPFIAASGVLHRFVSGQPGPSPELGEAYYLLGVIEANVGRSFWASQTEHFLETAIRIGPGEPYAEPAFALLEEFVVAGYTGSAGANVPPTVKRRLAELRELIDRAQSG